MEVTPEYKIALARELRQRQTESEARLWGLLRGHKLNGLHFRRQRPIGRFIADFCCEDVKLVVEVDGGYHDDPQQRQFDVEREAHFTGRGYTVLRVAVNEVMNDCRNVLKRIADAAKKAGEPEIGCVTGTPLPSAGEGQGVGA